MYHDLSTFINIDQHVSEYVNYFYGQLTVCELENGPVEIVDLPRKNGWIFPSFFKLIWSYDPWQ